MDKAKNFEMFRDHVDSMPENKFNALSKNVKEWYVRSYPTDPVGHEIPDYATFYDVVDALYCQRDIYIYLIDSIVRERVFEELAIMLSLSYDTIYETWLFA